jgi:hypothetical protein
VGNDKKTVLAKPGQPRIVAEDTKVDTFVKDDKGTRTRIHDTARKGEYLLADPGPKPAPAQTGSPPAAPAADVVPLAPVAPKSGP